MYNKYFKINAKKISKNAYDYYPNKVMKIKIFKDSNYTHIEDLSKQVLQRLKNGESNISDLEYKINNLIRHPWHIITNIIFSTYNIFEVKREEIYD